MFFSDIARDRIALKVSAVVLLSIGLLWFVGCDVTSINALYEGDSDSDLVFASGLLGSWQVVDQKCTTIVTVTAKDKSYDFRSVSHGEGCADSGKELHQTGHLLKLDSHYFLDLEARDDQVCDTCLPTHWIALTEFDDHKLALTPIDSDGLGELIRMGVVNLSTLPSNSDDDFQKPTMLTARSRDLKEFCRQFATDLTVFKPESTETLERGPAGE
jgi:hypothetical protein